MLKQLIAVSCIFSAIAFGGENLLKSAKLNISNKQTTVENNGIYTITNADDKTRSSISIEVPVEMNEPQSIYFAIEAKAEENGKPNGCEFGCIINLKYTDGTSIFGVNFGMGDGKFNWKTQSRTYLPQKAVKSITYIAQYNNCKGKIHFRKPVLRIMSAKETADLAKGKAPAVPENPYGKLKITVKDRHLETVLVRKGKPQAAIAGDTKLAAKVNAAIKRLTGVELPVVSDKSYGDADKLDTNLILIGNRDRNRAISNLYNRHFTLLDARYPGKGGSDLHSLHNPFGDLHNVILAGGSDEAGDEAAVGKLVKLLGKQKPGHNLTLGFISDATLSPKYKLARDVKDIPLWEQSIGYGNKGYFGWNSLAKNLAMLYITNDKYYKDEFMRLAFPKDKATCDELFARDDEAYHDKSEPIVKVYHYRGEYMLLYWDMVDENPIFTDEERLRVISKIYDMLVYRITRDDYTNPTKRYSEYVLKRPDRHACWEAFLVYTASRYLSKDYPCKDTEDGIAFGRNAGGPLFEYPIMGNIPLFWQDTSLELQIYYGLLQGHKYVGSKAALHYAHCLTTLSNREPANDNRTSQYTSLWTMLAGAYLAQDNAFITMLQDKQKVGFLFPNTTMKVDEETFRIGQSFWPVTKYPNDSIKDTLGKWYEFRTSIEATPDETEIQFTGYREKYDNSGDQLLIDPHYALGIREPQHNFSLMYGRVAGVPLLQGLDNALVPYAESLADLSQPFEGKIISSGHNEAFTWITGIVADWNGFDWERTWLLSNGKYLVAIDKLTARRDMQSARFDNRFAAGPAGAVTQLENGDLAVKLKHHNKDYECTWSFSEEGEIVTSAPVWNTYQAGGKATQRVAKQNIRKGDIFNFAAIFTMGKSSGKRLSAQNGNSIAFLTPAQAMLRMDKDGFRFFTSEWTFALHNGKDALQKAENGNANELGKVNQMIAARKTGVYAMPPIVENIRKPAWKEKCNDTAGLVRAAGSNSFLVASNKTVNLINADNGKILKTMNTSGRILSMDFAPKQKLIIVGCSDEKVIAFNMNGKQVWSFTSEMAEKAWEYGPYHHKSDVPGAREVYVREDGIYVGSACTVEIVNFDGSLKKRLFILYGPVQRFIEDEANGGVLVVRPTGGCSLFRIDNKYNVAGIGWNAALHDNPDTYGFCQASQYRLEWFKNSKKQLVNADIITGVQNRLIIRDGKGKPLHEANFGTGEQQNYPIDSMDKPALCRRTIRDLAIEDIDADGSQEILLMHNNGTIYLFDEICTPRKVEIMPSEPLCCLAFDNSFYIGLRDGKIVRIGKDLTPKTISVMKAPVISLTRIGKSIAAGSLNGDVCLWK